MVMWALARKSYEVEDERNLRKTRLKSGSEGKVKTES